MNPTEGGGVAALVAPGPVLLLLALGGAVVGYFGLVRRILRRSRRLGVQSRRFERLLLGSRIVVLALAAWIVTTRIVAVAPWLGMAFLVGATAVFAVAQVDGLRSLVVGLAPHWRDRIRPGDRLQVEEVAGVVSHFGLFSLELVSDAGETVHVPNSRLARSLIAVQGARDANLVRVRLAAAAQDDASLGVLRRVGLLSPYRTPGSPVRVQVEEGAVRVEIQAWSREAVEVARAHLSGACGHALRSREEA